MASSAQLDFNLQALLEQLSQDELSKFKSLIRTISLGKELQTVPQMEVDKANGKQLVEIFTSHSYSYWAGMAAIQGFEKMNETHLSERADERRVMPLLSPLRYSELMAELDVALALVLPLFYMHMSLNLVIYEIYISPVY
uniref:Pyrin domain containing 2 n=3 Tax=Cercopithecinae TaxID=9528 RepID=A0A2K6B1L2_MACNE|nr:pyrin domain-containing protein 2 [Macaca nemestrina]